MIASVDDDLAMRGKEELSMLNVAVVVVVVEEVPGKWDVDVACRKRLPK